MMESVLAIVKSVLGVSGCRVYELSLQIFRKCSHWENDMIWTRMRGMEVYEGKANAYMDGAAMTDGRRTPPLIWYDCKVRDRLAKL